jgi:hypothetical protein
MSVSAVVHLSKEPLKVKVLDAGQPDVLGFVELSRDPAAVDLIIRTAGAADRLLAAVTDLKQQLLAGGAS